MNHDITTPYAAIYFATSEAMLGASVIVIMVDCVESTQ